ncbi:hypothetical protein BVC80_1625g26 [Macleaya cordata]|uniref:Uncharacterized protein n=1 Tax=Macleaya cordata TaxID=56857 RepID=A0A200Q1E5_MACCD|nr:hypothetical protein BVC80_1625g26 [Macleaya cordata]
MAAGINGQMILPFPFSPTDDQQKAMMLTLPLQALAETCEANNSLFDMPLLLAVALIGATVGGETSRSATY